MVIHTDLRFSAPTFVSEVAEDRPDFPLNLLVFPAHLWRLPLPQPQGGEQVDPPAAHWAHAVSENPSRVSAAFQGHVLQQRGQVSAWTPGIGLCGRPPSLRIASRLLFSWWLLEALEGANAKCSLRRWPVSAAPAMFGPPGVAEGKWIRL